MFNRFFEVILELLSLAIAKAPATEETTPATAKTEEVAPATEAAK